MEHYLVFWFRYDIYTDDRCKELQIVVVLKGIGEDEYEIILVPYLDLWSLKTNHLFTTSKMNPIVEGKDSQFPILWNILSRGNQN